MAKSNNGLADDILEFLVDLAQLLPRPFETPYMHLSRIRNLEYRKYYKSVYYLKRKGLLQQSKKGGQVWIQATRAAELRVLFHKAAFDQKSKWDGRWRFVIFDIPESARSQRALLRSLLRVNNFYKLQASVFVCPYPLNREAVLYLKETDLIKYIRILRVDEIDDDSDLRKRFKIKF